MPTRLGNSDTTQCTEPREFQCELVARVLLVSSDPVRLAACARQLEDAGIRTATARTGFEAIVKACWHLPEIIVMQETLMAEEGVDGTVAAQMIRVCPATAHIPIVDAGSVDHLQALDEPTPEFRLLAKVARELSRSDS